MKPKEIEVDIKLIRAIERIVNDWLFNVIPENAGVEATLDDIDLVQGIFFAKKTRIK